MAQPMSKAPKQRHDDRGCVGLDGDRRALVEAAAPARVAVIFGGPSPEHDVSILTGLQAVRGLDRCGGHRRACIRFYWTKSGEWFEVRAATEAAGFVEGVPGERRAP